MEGIGDYGPAPDGIQKGRVGVAQFDDKAKADIGDQAGVQLETLVHRSKRFTLVDRTQLDKILKEQDLEGVVEPSELAKAGKVRGVDYLFVGAITNFRVKVTKQRTGFGIGKILSHVAGIGLDVDTNKIIVETQVGVDIKLVNTTTGTIVAKDFGEVKREDVASSWGLKILSIGGDAQNELQIDADSKGKILRWALDESLKKMMPDIDDHLTRDMQLNCPKCKREIPKGTTFCDNCGVKVEFPKCANTACAKQLKPGAKFCPFCGQKTEKK
jgi:curli biogenesis system outer membrane secretion channel CsgG